MYESMNTISCSKRASSIGLQHAASTSTSEIWSFRRGLARRFLFLCSVSIASTLSASTSAPGNPISAAYASILTAFCMSLGTPLPTSYMSPRWYSALGSSESAASPRY